MSEQKSKNHLKQKINGNQKCAVRNGTLCCLCFLIPYLSHFQSFFLYLSLSLSASRVLCFFFFFPSFFANFRNFIFADVSSYGITYHRHHHLRLFPLIHSFNILSVADSKHNTHTFDTHSGNCGGVFVCVYMYMRARSFSLSLSLRFCLILIQKHIHLVYELCECVYKVNGEVKRRRQ